MVWIISISNGALRKECLVEAADNQ